MKKLRYYLAIIALAATLSGPALQGMGSMANAASSQHTSSVSASFVAGKSSKSVAIRRYPPCGSVWDC